MSKEKPIPTETMLTEAELAKRWNVSVRTLRWQRKNSKKPGYVKIGKSIRYPLSGVLDVERDPAGEAA